MVGATSSEDSLIAAALERVNCTAASLEASLILGGVRMKLRETSQMPGRTPRTLLQAASARVLCQ